MSTISFSDLARAAYCPRQLYYARNDDDRSLPEDVAAAIDLAFEYRHNRMADAETLAEKPIELEPAAYRRALDRLRDGPLWPAVADPSSRGVFVAGRDCHGRIDKLLEPDAHDLGEEPVPSIVSPGRPPDRGVWEPQSVRAVAAAKALAWEREREIPRAIVEYPTVGVVRTVDLTVRRRATYRRALRTARSIDGPPPRVNDSRCEGCSYRDRCGTRTRSIASLLGL